MTKANEIVGGRQAALAHGDDVIGNPGDQIVRRLNVHVERAEIPVVDADDARAAVERDGELSLVVHLDEHIEPVADGVVVQHFELDRSQRGDDQQHGVGAGRFRFQQLVLRHDEVLSQHRYFVGDGSSHRLQMLERAVEERRLGQHGNGGRAGGRVAACNRHGIVLGS